MKARVLRIAFGAALVLVGYMIGAHAPTTIHAQGMGTNVPSYYGRLVAGDSSSLWFEDERGTLRQITIPSGNTVYTVNRQR